jgi:serine/threonine-protein kinase
MTSLRRIGKYEIVEELGRGGFATVYKARDVELERVVALKVLHPHWAEDKQFVDRFHREARAAARLRHPHIVIVYEAGEADGRLYIAMEYLPGRTLQASLEAEGALPLERALPILEQVAEALDHAHAQGMVHRDVKPNNVMVEQTAESVRAVLTDFGLVKALAGSTASTAPGTLLGSPEYMAPEQADPQRAGEVGPAADRYALGVVAYQMLTGRVPFPGNTPATLYAHEHKPVPPPRSLCPGLPQAVEVALLRMLAKAPAERFPSACAFVAQLREVLLAERQAARLAPLYAQLQAAAARQEWAEVLALGGRIQALDPAYRDVAEWMHRARGRLRRPPRRPPRVRSAWLWPLVGGAVALLVVIGIAVVAFRGGLEPSPRPTETRPRPTATSRPTDTRVAPTATSRPTETSLPPTATLRATETPTPVHYTGARPPAEANIGDTWMRPADGMVMVYVPAGEFLMGLSDADGQADDDEKPQHTVYLDGYWIDRTEVTNAEYRKCVEAEACRKPGCWDDENYNAPDQPVVCVTWDDAQSYATWVGGRLPTEAEWEKAARGADGRIYPWGDEFDGSRLNYCDRNCTVDWKDTSADDGYAVTAPVGSYPAGASPYGALDMAGNVWEWVADRYEEGYYARSPARNPQGPDAGDYRVLRGGAFDDGERFVRCAARGMRGPDFWLRLNGFRLVASRAPG